MSAHSALASYGALCTVSALVAAVTGRTDESDTRLAEAAVLAQRTGETGPDVACFGPTNVAMYRMTSALERGDSALAGAAFQRSETLAALRLRSNLSARESVTGLLPRVRRDTAAGRELHGIAYRMGLPA